MTFISAYHDKYKDQVLVWERQHGQRGRVAYQAPHYFYAPDDNGSFTALTGEKLSRVDCASKSDFESAVLSFPQRFESDINPLERVLMDNYYGKEPPKLHIGMVDIEVDYNPDIGFANPGNAYAPVCAITLHRSDMNHLITVAVPPPGVAHNYIPIDKNFNDPDLVKNGVIVQENLAGDVILVKSEFELLEMFLRLIEDMDLLVGWNSEFFDMPYLAKRISSVLGPSHLRRLEFDSCPVDPTWAEVEKFGNKEQVINLHSRVQMDYLRMFRKFNLEGRDSYALGVIGEDDVGMPKLEYAGSLRDLYYNDFERFIRYNRHDIKIILALERKFKYLELANTMVHEATVNFDAVFGSVKLIDTAIINYAHNKKQRILFDRKSIPGVTVEGALVMTPRVGLHEWIASCDIVSLYPSCYRALNLSPEKIIGQFAGYESDWRKIYRRMSHAWLDSQAGAGEHGDHEMTLLLENGTVLTQPVDDFIKLFKESKYAVSAYGTVLDQSSGEGLVSEVLSVWFQGRKDMKKEAGKYAKEAEGILKSNGGNIEDTAYKKASELADYYDLQQGIRKVLLNSTYGATLNEFCRFHDPRLGASTTGTGRQITTFMINTVAEQLIGPDAPRVVKTITEVPAKVQHSGSGGGDSEMLGIGIQNDYTIDCPEGLGPIYSDTDSCYFSMARLVGDDKDLAVQVADEVVKTLNDRFPSFMETAFFCQPEFSDRIRTNREIVADRGILQAKKKYMMRVVDLEGKPIKEGDPKKELKTMGSDIKLTSTPRVIRAFLKEVVLMILRGRPKTDVEKFIVEFRKKLTADPNVNVLDYANTTSVKNLELYTAEWARTEKVGIGKARLPGNVRAALNHNEMLKFYEDKKTQPLRSGAKLKILWLRANQNNIQSIAFASETTVLPKWFVENFEVDIEKTEEKLIDKKLENFFGALGWDIPSEHSLSVRTVLEF